MSIITDEMVEAAARAAFMRGWVTPDGMTEPDLFALRRKTDPDVWRLAKDNARAAVAAVAPLIAKAEREACAKVAEEKRDGLEHCAHRRQEMEVFAYMVRATDAGDIADAIRARSTEEGQ